MQTLLLFLWIADGMLGDLELRETKSSGHWPRWVRLKSNEQRASRWIENHSN